MREERIQVKLASYVGTIDMPNILFESVFSGIMMVFEKKIRVVKVHLFKEIFLTHFPTLAAH